MLALSLFCTAAAYAQGVPAQQECKPARLTKSHTAAPVARPEVNVLCGANTVTQTFAAQPPSIDPPSATQKQPDNSAQGYSVMVALITGSAGVLGAFAGAFASFLVARAKAESDLELETKRLKANLIATERLRYLQDIRQRLSTLFQQLDFQFNVLKRPVAPGQSQATQQQLDEMSSEVMVQFNMIRLMLNPDKPDQAALINALDSSMQFMLVDVFPKASAGVRSFDDVKYANYRLAAFDAMTRLGVETWNQVKSLA